MLRKLSLAAIAILFVASFAICLMPQKTEALAPINKVKKAASIVFDGDVSYSDLYHSFQPTGEVTVSNKQGDSITLLPLDVGYKTSIVMTQAYDRVTYEQTFKDGGREYRVYTHFDFNKSSAGVKITYTGNLPQNGTVSQGIILPYSKTDGKSLTPRYIDDKKTIYNGQIDTDGLMLSGVGFDWLDAPNATYVTTGSGVVLKWSVGTSFTIDPSTVGLTTDFRAVGFGSQRHSFYAQNLHWVFYSDGVNGIYRTSTDGEAWSNAVTFRAGITVGYHFSLFYDGIYMHYCYNNDVANTIMYYRRGEPELDGTITWSAAEQTAIAAVAGTQYRIPSIAPDSAGYLYIGYRNTVAGVSTPYVTRSGNNDGTWGATPGGFPYQLNINNTTWRVAITPLTATKMGIFYVGAGSAIYIQSYTGIAWNAEVNTGGNLSSECAMVAADGEDNVHVFTQDTITQNLVYWLYQYSTNTFISASVAYYGGLPLSYSTVTYDNDDDMLYAIWTNTPSANRVYYKRYDPATTTWDAEVTLLADETIDTFGAGIGVITSNYYIRNDVMACMYLTKAASPYNVRYAWRTTADIAIDNAKVFTSYIEDDDWLITLLYQNFTEPYYTQGVDVAEYFYIQLVSGNVTIAQTKCPQWGYRPGQIYLSAAQVTSLEWGYPYVVRLWGNFSGYPVASYTLTQWDWMGVDLNRLDAWVRQSAITIEDYYTVTLTTYVADKGIVLNEDGGVIFSNGIPALQEVRPDLFQIVSITPTTPTDSYTQQLQVESVWQTMLGPYLTSTLTAWGTVFSVSGSTIGAFLAFVFYGVVAMLAFPAGSAVAAISIPFGVLMVAWYTGLIPLAALGVILALAAFFLIWQFWLKSAS